MDLVSTPDNPAPPGAHCSTIVTSDGVSLRAMSARVANARGTIVILGGRADFMERYFETMRDLMARGYCVASLDLRGQGGSQRMTKNPLRGHVDSFDEYDEDVRSFMTQVVLPDCPPPYFALAHSTGGNIALRALRQRNWFKKTLLVSPLIDLKYGAWPVPIVKVLTFAFNLAGLGWLFLPGRPKGPMGAADFAANPLSRDQRRWNRDCAVLEANPKLGVGAPTYKWLLSAIKAIAVLRRMKGTTRLRCPVLIVMAGQDAVVDNDAARAFAQRVPGVSLTVIREALHEILLERDEIRAQFFAAMDAFLADTA
jgi:lysophospholipase